MTFDFNAELEELLPKMRVWALGWLRDKDRANDLVQDTALRVLEKKDQFDGSDKFSQWVSRIMYNLMVTQFRTRRVTCELDHDAHSVPPHQESGIVARELRELLDQIPRDCREAMLLAYEEGKSYAEIANFAKVSEGTVKSRISRGRDRLAILLGRGLGKRANRIDDIIKRRSGRAGSDMNTVLKNHPRWFCLWDMNEARIMNEGVVMVAASHPAVAWKRARELLEGDTAK